MKKRDDDDVRAKLRISTVFEMKIYYEALFE